jgi:beta-hydroxylase
MCNNKPIIDEKNMDKEFENNKQFEDKYNEIKREFDSYVEKKDIRCFRETNQLLNNIDTFDKKNDYCWRTLYLKMGGVIDEKMKKEFPETVKLLERDQIYNAFFSILDPKIDIKPHYGYYKGYLRYHLGLIIPEENGESPYLICGDEVYYWKEGKGVIFDDMFLHYVKNPTNKTRVVLYLDIKRNNLDPVTKKVVDLGNMLIDATPLTRLMINKQHKQSKLI